MERVIPSHGALNIIVDLAGLIIERKKDSIYHLGQKNLLNVWRATSTHIEASSTVQESTYQMYHCRLKWQEETSIVQNWTRLESGKVYHVRSIWQLWCDLSGKEVQRIIKVIVSSPAAPFLIKLKETVSVFKFHFIQLVFNWGWDYFYREKIFPVWLHLLCPGCEHPRASKSILWASKCI